MNPDAIPQRTQLLETQQYSSGLKSHLQHYWRCKCLAAVGAKAQGVVAAVQVPTSLELALEQSVVAQAHWRQGHPVAALVQAEVLAGQEELALQSLVHSVVEQGHRMVDTLQQVKVQEHCIGQMGSTEHIGTHKM